jgi:eukaryotic-like serine/threonine-protein kinase
VDAGRRTQDSVDSHETLTAPLRASGARPSAETVVLPFAGDSPKLLLERYRILAHLGAGGFGVVWRAHDQQLNREVAVKRIPLSLDAAGGHSNRERALREAQATARLSHPAIVALYEARAQGDAFYLISELVHGDTLAELIATDALDDELVLRIGLAIAGALDHAHERGVIHRDVKPHNVLVPLDPGRREEVAKLTDFGGAWMSGQEELTRTGDVLGTLAYMAPEQCEGREVTESSDLYSLALVLYEALSGANPVRAATPAATVKRIGSVLPSLGVHRADLPRELTETIDLALAPEPELRGSLDELCDELGDTLRRGLRQQRTRIVSRRPRGASQRQLRPRAEQLIDPESRLDPEGRMHPGARDAALQLNPEVDAPAERLGRLVCALSAGALAGAAFAWLGGTPPLPVGLAAALVMLLVAALPRLGWLLGVAALIGWQLLAERSGTALLLLAAALPVAPLLRRRGPEWSAPALAPLLGLAGLAGAFPALAGQAPRWRARAALGALGYWWLLLAEPLLGRRLWLGVPAHIPARQVWESSIDTTAVHVLGPLLSLGMLFGAALWALAALLLPLIVRGRSSALDFIAASAWSAALFAAMPMLDEGLPTALAPHGPRGALVGVLLGGASAIAARALRGPV